MKRLLGVWPCVHSKKKWRNHEAFRQDTLKGKVTEVKLGQIVGEVVLDIGGQKITSVITRDAIEEMGVKVGDEISAVIKSTEIMLLKS